VTLARWIVKARQMIAGSLMRQDLAGLG
jgi:hypothetical protein